MIELQIQPDGYSCVSTCLAMTVGIPVEVIIEAGWHKKYREDDESIRDMLAFYQVPFTEYHTLDRVALAHIETGVLWVTVASLNNPQGWHQILIEVYNTPEDILWKVFDPQAGREGQRYYTDIEELAESDPLATKLEGGYIIDAWIPASYFEDRIK